MSSILNALLKPIKAFRTLRCQLTPWPFLFEADFNFENFSNLPIEERFGVGHGTKET
jgi:hypothetical protein